MYSKERSDGQEMKHSLLKPDTTIINDELPSIVKPVGLLNKRMWYLYDRSEFCSEQDRYVTYPFPSVPRPVSRQNTPDPSVSPSRSPPTSPVPPPPKRQRVCGSCKLPGHKRGAAQQTNHHLSQPSTNKPVFLKATTFTKEAPMGYSR